MRWRKVLLPVTYLECRCVSRNGGLCAPGDEVDVGEWDGQLFGYLEEEVG